MLRLIAIGDEIDAGAVIHREGIQRGIFGEVFDLLGFKVVEPDIIGQAAAVAFPGAELAEDAVVGEKIPIGREGAETPAWQRQLFGEMTIDINQKKFADEIVEALHPRAEENSFP